MLAEERIRQKIEEQVKLEEERLWKEQVTRTESKCGFVTFDFFKITGRGICSRRRSTRKIRRRIGSPV